MKKLERSLSNGILIQGVVVVIVVGLLLKRQYGFSSNWFALLGLAAYLLYNGRSTWFGLRKWSHAQSRERARVVIYGLLAWFMVQELLWMQFSYFMILLLLGIDYLLSTRSSK